MGWKEEAAWEVLKWIGMRRGKIIHFVKVQRTLLRTKLGVQGPIECSLQWVEWTEQIPNVVMGPNTVTTKRLFLLVRNVDCLTYGDVDIRPTGSHESSALVSGLETRDSQERSFTFRFRSAGEARGFRIGCVSPGQTCLSGSIWTHTHSHIQLKDLPTYLKVSVSCFEWETKKRMQYFLTLNLEGLKKDILQGTSTASKVGRKSWIFQRTKGKADRERKGDWESVNV